MAEEAKQYPVYPELESGGGAKKETSNGSKKFLDNVCEDVSLIVKVHTIKTEEKKVYILGY